MTKKQLKEFIKRVTKSAKAWKKRTEITILIRDPCNATDDVYLFTVADTSKVQGEMEKVLQSQDTIKSWIGLSMVTIAMEKPELLKVDSRQAVDQEEARIVEEMDKFGWELIYPKGK